MLTCGENAVTVEATTDTAAPGTPDSVREKTLLPALQHLKARYSARFPMLTA